MHNELTAAEQIVVIGRADEPAVEDQRIVAIIPFNFLPGYIGVFV